MPTVLLAATILTAGRDCWAFETSLSGYYLGRSRDVFVGVLIATAACMVAYRGASMLEDYFLNLAGFFAVFVALVPTGLEDRLRAMTANGDVKDRVDEVWSLRFSLWLVLAVAALVIARESYAANGNIRGLWENQGKKAVIIVCSIVFALFVGFVVLPQLFQSPETVTFTAPAVLPWALRVHDIAAILLICFLAMAVASHAFPLLTRTPSGGARGTTAPQRWRQIYILIFALMLAGLPLLLYMQASEVSHKVLIIEVYEIVLFISFWVMETIRTRSAKPQERSALSSAMDSTDSGV